MSNSNKWESDSSALGDTVRQVNPLEVLATRKWLVFFGLLVGLGLAHLVYTRQTPIYQSSARLMITQRNKSNMPIDAISSSLAERADHILTQITVIRSPAVVSGAVAKFNLAKLDSLKNSADPTGTILANLGVDRAAINDRDRSPDVVDLTYQCENPSDCGKILAAVIDSYQTFLGDTEKGVSEEAVNLISEATKTLTEGLSLKEKDLAEFSKTTNLLLTDGAARNLHKGRVAEIELARSNLLVQRTELKSKIQAIDGAMARGARREALMIMLDSQAGDKKSGMTMGNELRSLADRLYPLLLEEQILLENYGADHPEVKATRKKIELTRDFIREQTSAGRDPDALDEPQDLVDICLEALRHELRMLDEREIELGRAFDTELALAKAVATEEAEYQRRVGDIERSSMLFDAIVKRLDEITLIKDAGGFTTRVLASPGNGGKIYPIMWMTLAAGGFAGLMLGYGLAHLSVLADRSFRSPDEIRRQIGVPVLGHVPVIRRSSKSAAAKKGSALDPTLCVFHRPKSHMSEAYRAVRTSLFFAAGDHQYQVIQITSPVPGDGKTTLASNLAVSIAQSGKRVLLVDADFRRPRVDKVFGAQVRIGLSSVIEGTADIEDATYATEATNLWLMPCGPKPHNPSELLTAPEFEKFLAVVREKYDFVIIDSPPLMAVSDPSVVAARVDGVILTVRLNNRTRVGLTRSMDVLRELGAPVIGVVVNGVGHGSQYGYGREYGTGYDYTYGYGYGASTRAYYAEDDAHGEFETNGARVARRAKKLERT